MASRLPMFEVQLKPHAGFCTMSEIWHEILSFPLVVPKTKQLKSRYEKCEAESMHLTRQTLAMVKRSKSFKPRTQSNKQRCCMGLHLTRPRVSEGHSEPETGHRMQSYKAPLSALKNVNRLVSRLLTLRKKSKAPWLVNFFLLTTWFFQCPHKRQQCNPFVMVQTYFQSIPHTIHQPVKAPKLCNQFWILCPCRTQRKIWTWQRVKSSYSCEYKNPFL